MVLSPIATSSQASNDEDNFPVTQDVNDESTYSEQQDAIENDLFDLPESPDNDEDYKLIWPECEVLCNMIVTAKPQAFTQPLAPSAKALNDAHRESRDILDEANSANAAYADNTDGQTTPSAEDVMSTSPTTSVAPTVQVSTTAAFLDKCLILFFDRFLPTLPIFHRSTFVLQEHAQSTLFSAMAVGSLYMEQQSSRQKGEALWHWAQKIQENVMSSLVTGRGAFDTWNGFQFLMTNLLCRVYGTLTSNPRIRASTRALTIDSFSWPSRCGMLPLGSSNTAPVPTKDASNEEKFLRWRTWVAQETHFRAVLGQYILDGLNCHASERSVQGSILWEFLDHMTSDAAFTAENVDEWIDVMQLKEAQPSSFQGIYPILFPSIGILEPLPLNMSFFPLRVILEGVQSLVCDYKEADDGPVAGATPKSDLASALYQVYNSITQTNQISGIQRLDLLLRWHTICLDLVISCYALRSALCHHNIVRPSVIEISAEPRTFSLLHWPYTTGARASLLHALSIQSLFLQLPADHSNIPIHVPSSLFAAGAVLSAFITAGLTKADVPERADWQDVLFTEVDPSIILGDLAKPSTGAGTREFIHGGRLSSPGVRRDLIGDIEDMRGNLKLLASKFGVAGEMERIVGSWIRVGPGI